MMTTYALDVFHDEMLYSYSRNHNVFSCIEAHRTTYTMRAR